MYEALDSFLNVSTWASGHSLDEARFYKALDGIVRHPEFRTERMAEYMRKKTATDSREPHRHADAISRCVDHADIILAYIRATET